MEKAVYDVSADWSASASSDVSKSIAESNPFFTCMWHNSTDIPFIKAQLVANRNEINCDSSLVIYKPSGWTSV